MHSSQIIENVAHDLVESGVYSALSIQNAIDSLNHALTLYYREELDLIMQDHEIEGAK
jgi:hypothetical protein